jgi:hypothetical protein
MQKIKVNLTHSDFFDLLRLVAAQIKHEFGEYRKLKLFPIDITCSYALISELPTIGIILVDSITNADIAVGRDERDTVAALVECVNSDLDIKIFNTQNDADIDAFFPWDYDE